jgi:hypothetical protein
VAAPSRVAKTSRVLFDVAEQVEAEGGISTENALATVCG